MVLFNAEFIENAFAGHANPKGRLGNVFAKRIAMRKRVVGPKAFHVHGDQSIMGKKLGDEFASSCGMAIQVL